MSVEFVACCPVCQERMRSDTQSGEEFSCPYCHAMLDILDEDLAMLSLPPHQEVSFIPSKEVLWAPVALVL